tara:strand:- start:1246 stop:1554 length:309 start_codon:yes stop_codon:yes gene_type:complete
MSNNALYAVCIVTFFSFMFGLMFVGDNDTLEQHVNMDCSQLTTDEKVILDEAHKRCDGNYGNSPTRAGQCRRDAIYAYCEPVITVLDQETGNVVFRRGGDVE